MSRFSRVLHHIDMNDVKRRHQEKIVAAKLEEERIREEKEYIASVVEKEKSDWKKELEESQWTPVQSSRPTNSTSQTFQHVSGTTATFAGLGGVEVHPSTMVVTGETVLTPTYNDLALAGYAKPLGIGRRSDYEDVNPKLDASQEFAQKVNADVMMNARVGSPEWVTEQAIQTAWKLISKLPNTRFNQELKVLFGYLSGNFKGSINNKFISKNHLTSLFKKASIRGDGRVQMDDFIVGSGQKLVYNPNTNTWGVSFNYDFAKNASELATSNPGWLKRTLGPILFGQYSHDANMFGPLVQHAKNMGRGQNIKGEFTFDADELSKLNPSLIQKTLTSMGAGIYGSKVWNPSMMGMPFGTGPVHNYYALTGQLPRGSVVQGSVPDNYGDHAEYDPAVIARIDRVKKAQAAPLKPSDEPDTYDWRKDTVVRKKKVTKDT